MERLTYAHVHTTSLAPYVNTSFKLFKTIYIYIYARFSVFGEHSSDCLKADKNFTGSFIACKTSQMLAQLVSYLIHCQPGSQGHTTVKYN